MSEKSLNKIPTRKSRPIGCRKRKAIIRGILAFRNPGDVWSGRVSLAAICSALGVERPYLAAVVLYGAPPTRELALKLDLLATCHTLPGLTAPAPRVYQ